MGKRLIIPGADFSANAIEKEPVRVPVEYTLQNGFASVSAGNILVDNDASANLIRVRTNEITGSYTIKTKPGYVIRAIVKYDTPLNISDPGSYSTTNAQNVSNVQGLTEYTLSNDGKYSIITLCKTNSNETISASEDIVDYIIRPLE